MDVYPRPLNEEDVSSASKTIIRAIMEKKKELSGVMVVIIIGGGVLLSIVLFIFAKRQIMRFTIRSRRGPHAPVGHDAKKVLFQNHSMNAFHFMNNRMLI